MKEPVLYIFDPENLSEDFIEVKLEKGQNEYTIHDYVFLANSLGGVSVSFRVDVNELKFFINIKENGKQKIGFSGKKTSADSSDPIIIYTCDCGDSYQFSIQI